MKIIERIKARSSRKNRRQGQLATVGAVVLPMVAHSGLVDSKPELKIALDLIGGILGVIAGNKAIQTEETLKKEENVNVE